MNIIEIKQVKYYLNLGSESSLNEDDIEGFLLHIHPNLISNFNSEIIIADSNKQGI